MDANSFDVLENELEESKTFSSNIARLPASSTVITTLEEGTTDEKDAINQKQVLSSLINQH